MAIDEDTITIFLARLSLDAGEQRKYFKNPEKYLEHVYKLSSPKKKILLSKDKTQIARGVLGEQVKGSLICVIATVATY